MSAAGTTDNAIPAINSQNTNDAGDMASVLARIKALEEEKKAMADRLASNDAKYAKLQEAKKAEMEAMMNSTISKWLESLESADAESKEKLRVGLTDLANRADENAVWSVVACASSSWAANVNRLEELTTRLNDYQEKEKQWNNSNFQSDESRIDAGVLGKRRADDISPAVAGDIWSELEGMMKANGGGVIPI